MERHFEHNISQPFYPILFKFNRESNLTNVTAAVNINFHFPLTQTHRNSTAVVLHFPMKRESANMCRLFVQNPRLNNMQLRRREMENKKTTTISEDMVMAGQRVRTLQPLPVSVMNSSQCFCHFTFMGRYGGYTLDFSIFQTQKFRIDPITANCKPHLHSDEVCVFPITT